MKRPFPVVPGYHIERPLGEGGMAHVYLATQLSLDRQVAIKVVRFAGPDSEALSTRFENEARTIAQLEHPSIVGVFDVGRTIDGLPYYTMAYLPNGDLAKADIHGDNERIAEILETIARALGFAHAQGVIHRDVKPENVLFDREHRARLADFGISRSMHRSVRVTEEGYAPGSAAYMSPEQSRGALVDARSDLYSLGVVAFELLSGTTPYQRTDPVAMALAHHELPIPRLPSHQSQWQPLIDKALAKQPDARFQTAEEFIAALMLLKNNLAATRIDPALALPVARTSAHPYLVWALLVVSMVAVGGLLWRQYSAMPSVASSMAAARASSSEAARQDPLLAELPARIEARHWFEPATGSASNLLADALAKSRSPQHLQVADDFVVAVGAVIVEAIQSARDAPALALLDKLRAFVGSQTLGERKSVVRTEAMIHAALDQRLRLAESEQNVDMVAALDSALLVDPELAPRWQQLATAWSPGRVVQDERGPPMRVIDVAGVPVAMMAHEVSRSDYSRFQTAMPSTPARCRPLGSALGLVQRHDWRDPGFKQAAQHPVVCVSAADARSYARWLSAQTGQRYRLPTLAEWRAAADRVNLDQSVCKLGNIFDRSDERKLVLRDRYECADGAESTQSVGRYAASPWGIHDLVGNVAEWVDDCTPARADCASARILGSSWRSGREQPLLDARPAGEADPALDVGFRLVRDLQPGRDD